MKYETKPIDDLLEEADKCIRMGMPPSFQELVRRVKDINDRHQPFHDCGDSKCPFITCSCGVHPCLDLAALRGFIS